MTAAALEQRSAQLATVKEEKKKLVQKAASLLEEAAEAAECAVCIDKERTHIFMPCGHRCVCEECSAMVMLAAQPLCPFCRVPATSSSKAFL